MSSNINLEALCFSKEVIPLIGEVDEAKLGHVRSQIDLCQELSNTAANLLKKFDKDPFLLKDRSLRARLASQFLGAFYDNVDYPSIDYFCSDVRESGFDLTKPLYFHYRDGIGTKKQAHGPTLRRMWGFMSAMSKLDKVIGQRFITEFPVIKREF